MIAGLKEGAQSIANKTADAEVGEVYRGVSRPNISVETPIGKGDDNGLLKGLGSSSP